MNETIESNSSEQASLQNTSSDTSAGAMLREARELEGLDIAALAVSLKVPVKKLEALEADRFDLLPDTVFARALAASVCRTLKIDSTLILARLPYTAPPSLKTDELGINAPFRTSSGGGAGLFVWSQLNKPFVWAISALLLGVVVMVLLPLTPQSDVMALPKAEVPMAALSNSEPIAVPIAAGSLTDAEVVLPKSSQNLTPSNSDSLLPVNSVSALSPASAPASVVSAVPAVLPASGMTTGSVVFVARGSSWIEVVDSQGVVQVRKTITSGEVVSASGAMPLAVVVGRADTTDVQVRGKPFDLTRIAKDNVARFEVK